MNLKRLIMLIVSFLFAGVAPAFADGGIPLWIYTAHTAIGLSVPGMGPGFIESIIWTLIILTGVIGIETFVVGYIFKFKELKKVFSAIFWGNLITTIIGAIITLSVFHSIVKSTKDYMDLLILGPYAGLLNGYGLVVGNILLFLMSFLVEYYIARSMLSNIFELQKIKIAFLSANIASYILPLIAALIVLFGVIAPENGVSNIPYIAASVLVVIGTIIFIYLFINKDKS